MDDLVAAVAEKLGAPADLVLRSAQARAQAQGVDVESVLRAWAGGEAAPAATAAPAETATTETGPTETATAATGAEESPAAEGAAPEAPPTPVPATATPAATVPAPAPSGVGPAAPSVPRDFAPVLVAPRQSLVPYLAGSLALLFLGALIILVAATTDARGDDNPNIDPPAYTAEALDGREIYLREGCTYCHTQLVRPVLTDVGLGPVTIVDRMPALSPDTAGVQRIGPDLANAGAREPTNDPAWIVGFLRHPSDVRPEGLHPSYGFLSDGELRSLAAYLTESR